MIEKEISQRLKLHKWVEGVIIINTITGQNIIVTYAELPLLIMELNEAWSDKQKKSLEEEEKK